MFLKFKDMFSHGMSIMCLKTHCPRKDNVTSVLRHFRPTILQFYLVNPTYAGTADLVSM